VRPAARPAFPGARRQAVSADPREWVAPAAGAGRLPLEVRAQADVRLADWARAHPEVLDAWLAEHGAVLFAGFGVSLDDFGDVAAAVAGPPLPYRERSSPRAEVAPGIYTSTEYPPDQAIPVHNENSYQAAFPSRLAFCCLSPAERGGATPLADCRRVLSRIDPGVLAGFRDRDKMGAIGGRRNRTPRLRGGSWRPGYTAVGGSVYLSVVHNRSQMGAVCRRTDANPVLCGCSWYPGYATVAGRIKLPVIHVRDQMGPICRGRDSPPILDGGLWHPGHAAVAGSVNLSTGHNCNQIRAVRRRRHAIPVLYGGLWRPGRAAVVGGVNQSAGHRGNQVCAIG